MHGGAFSFRHEMNRFSDSPRPSLGQANMRAQRKISAVSVAAHVPPRAVSMSR
jgi:hypothetical protein